MVWRYIKFWLKSTNQHGVHSPFVYNLITKCFYDKTKYSDYKLLKAYRHNLLKSKETIEVTDLGARSRVMKHNTRSISKITKTAGSTLKRNQLLYRIIKYLNIESTLELGTSLGISTYAMVLANSKNNIITVEGCPNTISYTKSIFKNLNVDDPIFKQGSFKSIIPKLEQPHFDLIFFDGHHDKEATIGYFQFLLDKIHNDSVFIFDDIYWSKGMTEAWEFIKNHPKVKVTVDTFFWGFVFFRKEQEKQHFTIRA